MSSTSSPSTPSALRLSHLSFTWPDGSSLLDSVDLVLGPGRHALLGSNGSGKSTLLRLLTGELAPTSGHLEVGGRVRYLAQDPLTHDHRSVSAALGISERRAALRQIEAGVVEQRLYDLVGDDWDIEERARAELDRLGLTTVGLDRDLSSLSGGELALLSLAAQLLDRPDVLLLDEPTNNLDAETRERVGSLLTDYRGCLLVATHDRTLLDRVDDIVELHAGRLRVFPGAFDAYAETVAAEQEQAARVVRDAKSELRRQQRELVETQVKLSHRERTAAKAEREKRVPKIVSHGRRSEAQVSAGRLRGEHQDDVVAARDRLSSAEGAVRDDREIRLELPGTRVAATREVARTRDLVLAHTGSAVELHVRGPERVALRGRNGSGKSTLLATLVGLAEPASGSAEILVPFGYLPQRENLLEDGLDVVDNVRRHAPEADPHEIRAQLARLLFRGDSALRPAGTLSGGERFRATLACLLLRVPAPQLLILDEPTNNLDLTSVAHLTQALNAYHGALLLVSHDAHFVKQLGIDRHVVLDR